MHGTQLSSHPKIPLEEDRESGIGSTLDLSGSLEGYNQHNNHLSNTASLREADRLPEERGTRVAWRRRITHSSPGFAAGLMSLKRQMPKAEAEPHAH